MGRERGLEGNPIISRKNLLKQLERDHGIATCGFSSLSTSPSCSINVDRTNTMRRASLSLSGTSAGNLPRLA